MELRRAHQTLNLPPNSSLAAARLAYREQLRRHHPDTGTGDPSSLPEVRTAYRTIVASGIAVVATPQPQRRPLIDVYA